jgi:glycosyltransferase involved in cell wall biosynthesis
MIRVAIDIRDLKLATTGSLTYLEAVIYEFKKGRPGFEFLFFDTNYTAYLGSNPLYKIREHIRFFIWKQITLPYKAYQNKCDIVFCTDYFVPICRFNFVTIPVFHDAFFKEYPAHYNRLWLILFNFFGLWGAKNAKAIVVPTHYAAERVATCYELSIDKIKVVYEAPKITLNQKELLNDLDPSLPMVEGKYILHVGTFDKRKNIPFLIKAFKALVQQGHTNLKLVLVGSSNKKMNSDATNEIQAIANDPVLKDKIILTGYLDKGNLLSMYQNAFIYVFPSINEGFGLPILEAFKFQLPLLIANNTCMPEVAADAAIGFDPYNVNDLVAQLNRFIQDEHLRNDLIQKGNTRLQEFNWEKSCNQLLDIFKQAVHS